MKAILFLLCLSAAPAFSQNYHPFIQHGVYRDEFWAPELQFCYYSHGDRFWFRGDTTIGGQTYHILRSAPIASNPAAPDFCPPYTVDTNQYTRFALLREDLAAQRVYQYDSLTQTEFLLYDFLVDVGESVTVGVDPPQTLFVQAISTEMWPDGSTHRVIELLSQNGEAPRWIEGLGNMHSLWHPGVGLCICPHALCYQQNGMNLYGDVCATAVRTEEARDALAALLLTPNPAGHTITVAMTGQNQRIDHLTIFDIAGRPVLERGFSNGAFSVELPVDNLPSGSYVILAEQAGKWLGRQRFQKI